MPEKPEKTKNETEKIKSRNTGRKRPYWIGIFVVFLILFLGWELLTCHWIVQQFWLPAISHWTGLQLEAQKVEFSLALHKNSVQISVRDLEWRDEEEQVSGSCQELSGRIYWHDLLFRRIVLLDQVEIRNGGMKLSHRDLRNRPIKKKDCDFLYLGTVSAQNFILQYEITPDMTAVVKMQNLQAGGFLPGKTSELKASLEFSAAEKFPGIRDLRIQVQMQYSLNGDLNLNE